MSDRSASHQLALVAGGKVSLVPRRQGRRGLDDAVRRELLSRGLATEPDGSGNIGVGWIEEEDCVTKYQKLKMDSEVIVVEPEPEVLPVVPPVVEAQIGAGAAEEATRPVLPSKLANCKNIYHQCLDVVYKDDTWLHVCQLGTSKGRNHSAEIRAYSASSKKVLSGNLKKHFEINHNTHVNELGMSWYSFIEQVDTSDPVATARVVARVRSAIAEDKAIADKSTVLITDLLEVKPKNDQEVLLAMGKLRHVAWLTKTSTPFNLADDQDFREWVKWIDVDPKTMGTRVPHRDVLGGKYLDTLYACVLLDATRKLQQAHSFGITFDAWSSRRKRKALVSVTYHYVDADMKPVEVLLDAIPTYEGHTAVNLAVQIAKRIEARTGAHQFLYTATTDNASNVRQAAQYIVDRYKELQALEPRLDSDFSADEMSTLAFDDDCEPERSIGCVAHAVNLAVVAMYKLPAVSALINKVTAIVAAYGYSTKRQQALTRIQQLRGSPVRVLIAFNETRWNSLKKCIQRFVDMYEDVLCAFHDGVFARGYAAASEMSELMPVSRIELEELRGVLRLLEPVEEFSVFLQGGEYFTLANTLYFYDQLMRRLRHCDVSNLQVAQESKDRLQAQLQLRMAPFLEPGPALVAALVHPVHFAHAKETCRAGDARDASRGMAPTRLEQCRAMLKDWYRLLFPDDRDEDKEHPGDKRKYTFDDDPEAVSLKDLSYNTQVATKVQQFLQMVEEFGMKLWGPDGELTGELDIARPIAYDDLARKFYSTLDDDLQILCALVLGGVISSASSERAFSASGLIDSALRNRIAAPKVEKLTVVQAYLRRLAKHPVERKQFWERVERWLCSPADRLDLEAMLNKCKLIV